MSILLRVGSEHKTIVKDSQLMTALSDRMWVVLFSLGQTCS